MTDEQKARLSTKRPLTKEEYEARQSVIRRVVDPETGRTRWAKVHSTSLLVKMFRITGRSVCFQEQTHLNSNVIIKCSCNNFYSSVFFSSRLVRGEGEIIEEIVSREKHKDINKVQEKVSIIPLWKISYMISNCDPFIRPTASHQGRWKRLPEETGNQQVEDAEKKLWILNHHFEQLPVMSL